MIVLVKALSNIRYQCEMILESWQLVPIKTWPGYLWWTNYLSYSLSWQSLSNPAIFTRTPWLQSETQNSLKKVNETRSLFQDYFILMMLSNIILWAVTKQRMEILFWDTEYIQEICMYENQCSLAQYCPITWKYNHTI